MNIIKKIISISEEYKKNKKEIEELEVKQAIESMKKTVEMMIIVLEISNSMYEMLKIYSQKKDNYLNK